MLVLRVEVRFAWWLRPYLALLTFFCRLHGDVPDIAKLRAVMDKAVDVKAVQQKKPCQRCQKTRDAVKRFLGVPAKTGK